MLQGPDFELGPGIQTLTESKMDFKFQFKRFNHLCSILILWQAASAWPHPLA